jgi:hypothetical protein
MANAGTWLKPGAWGKQRERCSEQLRRGFRPTLMGTSQGCGAAGGMVRCLHWRSLLQFSPSRP